MLTLAVGVCGPRTPSQGTHQLPFKYVAVDLSRRRGALHRSAQADAPEQGPDRSAPTQRFRQTNSLVDRLEPVGEPLVVRPGCAEKLGQDDPLARGRLEREQLRV